MGDRKDGKLIRELDSLHFVTGVIYPNRCDNEAFISEKIDISAINEYLLKKNASYDPDGQGIESYKYNLFQVIVAALVKTLTLRPKMNRFIQNRNFYQHNDVSTAFVVKKLFSDDGAEALAYIHYKDDDTIESIHQKIYQIVSKNKMADDIDGTTQAMDVFNKMPRFLSKLLIRFTCWLDRHGWMPKSLIADDPYYSSCVISNLGSIKMKSGYHHLTNWGACSMIVLIGEIKSQPWFKEDGTFEIKPTVEIGMTIDERIADGYYYSKTMRLLRKLLQNPKLLELPMNEEIDY